MFNVRLAGGHLYGKQLFTWLSLVVSFMASFVLSFFPAGCLGWDLGLAATVTYLQISVTICMGHAFNCNDRYNRWRCRKTHDPAASFIL